MARIKHPNPDIKQNFPFVNRENVFLSAQRILWCEKARVVFAFIFSMVNKRLSKRRILFKSIVFLSLQRTLWCPKQWLLLPFQINELQSLCNNSIISCHRLLYSVSITHGIGGVSVAIEKSVWISSRFQTFQFRITNKKENTFVDNSIQ